jgi:hypothetical protein
MTAMVSYPTHVGRALADAGALLVLVFSIPLVVLAVGTPIALAILAVSWVGHWALNAF